MKKFLQYLAILLTSLWSLSISASASAQTVSLNDGAVLQNQTNRVGVNIGAIDYWDQGQILKNLIGSMNPGMEPLQDRQIWSLTTAGTTTTFTNPDIYDGVPPNYWTGGTFTVVEAQSSGGELGCTGTIASNTGPNYPLTGQSVYYSPTVTVSSPCAAPFSPGDIIILSLTTFPTPETWWETGGRGGTSGSVSGGAQLLSDTTDLCATCGTQALNMNATASGSKAVVSWGFDAEWQDNVFVLMNGTYQLSFWAKTASGHPTLTVYASRGSSGGFNCGSYTPALTSAWTQYTWNCTASENASVVQPTAGLISFTSTGGSLYLDNVSFQKTSTNPSNTTVVRDEVIETLQKFYGPSIGNNPGTLRYWVNQNAETISNWTQPDYAHMPTAGGTGYFVSPGGMGTETLSLEDYLALCQYLNAIPYLEVPVTLTTADAANLIEFLASPSTTTYGARRAALGQTAPWTSVFSTIHLAFCNECWNPLFAGQSLPARTTSPTPELYYDYSVRARDIFAAMRADQYYSQSALDLVMNTQTGNNSTMDTAIQRAHPDSIELEDYTMGSISSYATDAAIWGPIMVDPWEKVTNPNDIRNFYQSLHDYQSQYTCGANASTQCKVNIYEWGQGTISGGIDQTHLDYVNAGAGEGVVMALQPLLNLQYYGILPQSFFALTEYKNSASDGMISKLWGNTIDMGGATNNVRPTFMGVQLVNQSIIGPMFSCPINNNLTYNFAGSPNGNSPMPAMTNVPYLYAFCFENGTSRSLVLINTDLANSHTISFAGSNPPYGDVTVRQYAPSELDEMNEAPTGTATNLTPATSWIETSSLTSPTSITLPPFSATALDYTAQGPTSTAMPTFSPAAGTYTTAQSVTINDQTPGVSVYYTTDGTTPTTSSSLYSGAITVSANQTVEAIATESGHSTSPVGTAVYTIAPLLPTPTFSVAAGTYATTQSVVISDTFAGTTIYYTTNGTSPTTSSTIYSGAISIGSTETLEAIAVKNGYTNSNTATALYTIAPPLPVPTFSPAPGTFTSGLGVTITESVSGSVIYYTTNGTTPTTASTQYPGPLWLNSSETINAIAVQAGYANSPVVSGTFTIAPVLPTPTFSPTPGIFTTTQSVTISDSASGTTIYYTTNGTTPTTSSAVYSGPVTLSASATLQAIAVETGYTNSNVASGAYTINNVLSPPTFSESGGIYTSSQNITISDLTSGVTIYYTTNNTTPTTSSSVYSGAILVSSSETVQAIAVAPLHVNSPVATAAYTISGSSLPAPVFSLPAGTYLGTQTVSLSDAQSGSTIYYTTNGTSPTTSSTMYAGAITVSATETIEAIAAESGQVNSPVASSAYTITSALPTPTFSVAAGTYATTQSVAISDSAAGTTIYYTTTGTTPTTSSAVYTSAISVSATETIEAIAVKTGYTNSSTAIAAYTISSILPVPSFSPAPGTYTSSFGVTITDSNSSAVIYYTTNGTTPTTSSTQYGGQLWLNSSETINAIAVESGLTNSPVLSGTFTIARVLPTPTFSPTPGIFTTTQSVTISDSASGTTIYYTTNGTTPTTSSAVYSGPVTLSASATLQAIAVETGYTNSNVASGAYTINNVLSTPTFSEPGGIYTSSQNVTINDLTSGATIYYTTNNTAPTTSSSVYSGQILISSSETVQAIAVAPLHVNSPVATAAYTISGTPTAAAMSAPAPGSTLTGSSVNFTWTVGTDVKQYDLYVGTTGIGSSNIVASGALTAQSYAVSGIPMIGGTLYVRLQSLINGVWQHNDYTYTEVTAVPAAISTPSPGSTMTGSSATFTWTAGNDVTQYDLYVGTTGVGSSNIAASGGQTALTYTVSGIPTTGGTLYVRLLSLIGGTWQSLDYTYAELPPAAPALMSSPAAGSTLTGNAATFTWTAGSQVTQYALHIGTTGVGSSNLAISGTLTTLSYGITGIPTTGGTLYVRLYSLICGAWQYIDYTYTESNLAQLTSPTPGSTLTGSTAVLTWTAATGAEQYSVHVGTTGVGSSNVATSGALTTATLTYTITGIPTTGGALYVRLYSLISGSWEFNDYIYTEA